MEKDQLDSLATVAVGSEKMPPAHSHYAASDVYSASESPPAYTRPAMKSTAVQIARIIATTMIAISVIIGSFILAAAWLQARASCTPESIAAMRAQSNLQQPQNELIKHLQPEALIQERDFDKDNLQSLSESSVVNTKDEANLETKKAKSESEEDEKSKNDNDNGDESDSEDDYDDPDFPPVHIKLPLQLDLDDLAGSLLQQARSIVSCVVERHRSDDIMDGDDNQMDSNSTDRQRGPRVRGEHVAVLCESAEPHQEQHEQEMLTPIIVPLGTVQIPLQPQDRGYTSYQVHNQYQAPEGQRVQTPVDARPINQFPMGIFPPELRNVPQVSMEMGPPPRVVPQIRMRPQQMPMDQMHGMKPSVQQEQFIREQHQIPITFIHASGPVPMAPRQQHTSGMMPPPPPVSPQSLPETQHSITEPRILSLITPPRVEAKQPGAESQEVPERSEGPFRGIPIELRRIIQQVPLEINNIIQHITGDSRPVQTSVPEGARREQVQEFKPFPESMRPITVDPFALPIEVRNLLEHGNIEGNAQDDTHDTEEQEQSKPFPDSQDQSDEAEKRFPVPTNVMNIIHEIMEGRAFPVPRFAMPLRPMESLEIPMEAHAQVSDGQDTDEENQHQEQQQQNMPQQQQQQHQARMMMHPEEMQDEANRPHFVQPRSVRSVPEPFAHSREKRVRRRACECVC